MNKPEVTVARSKYQRFEHCTCITYTECILVSAIFSILCTYPVLFCTVYFVLH